MKILFFICSLLLTNIIYAQDSGFTALQFLRISPSPVASALGNSYASIAGNSDTMFYNPGSMAFFKLLAPSPVFSDTAFIRNMSFSLAYSSWFYSLNYMAFSSMFDLKSVGIIGLGFTTMIYDNIAETTAAGTLTGQQLGSSDSLFMASYANMLGEKIGIGANIKFASENIAGEGISGLAFDAGIRYHESASKWAIGFVVQNAGLSVKKIDQSFQLPLDFKIGGNYDFNIFKNNDIMLTGDIGTGLDYAYSLGVGLEYSFQKIVFLRTGYQYQGPEPGFKVGAGVKYKAIGIDYAYTPYTDLGAIHRIGITYQFGQQNSVKEKPEEDVTKTVTARGIEINISDVVFELKKAELRPEFTKILDKVVDMLEEYNDYDMMIEGHTDNIGTDEDNLELSLLRAKTVFNYFIDKGINPKNLSYIGYGKKHPLADNSTEAGRQKNRCVNILVTKKAAK